MSVAEPADYTFFTIVNISFDQVPNDGGRNTYFMGFGMTYPGDTDNGTGSGDNDARKPGLGIADESGEGKGRFFNRTLPAMNGTKKIFTPRSTTIAYHQVKKSNYIIFESDGIAERYPATGTTSAIGNNSNVMNASSMLGTGGRPGRNVIGNMGEIIAFETVLTPEEKIKVYSYLALKYGVTIDINDNKFDYIFSEGTSVWPGSTSALHRKYHNNVAAIARDDDANLHTNISHSTNEEGIVTMLLSGGAPMQSTSLLANDRTAIAWGDNGAANDVDIVSPGDCLPFEQKYKKIWMIDRSQITEAVDLTLRAGNNLGNFRFEGGGWEVYLMVAKTEANAISGNWDIVIPGAFVNGEHEFQLQLYDETAATSDKGYLFFSFGATQRAGICPTCSFAGEDLMRMDKTNTNIGSGVRLTPNTSRVVTLGTPHLNTTKITFETTAGVTMRVAVPPNQLTYPVHLRATGTVNNLCRITYDMSHENVPVPANVRFAVGDIDNNESIYVYGKCGGSIVKPSYVTPAPLTGNDLRRGHGYRIQDVSKAVGLGRDVSGRNNPRAKLFYEFGFSVEQIIIEYTSSGSPSARWLDLYPMYFDCPQPPAPPNEAGYSLQKRGTPAVSICGVVNYSFNIVNANAGCDSSIVKFQDILPDGMFWIPNSLVVDNSLLAAEVTDPVIMNGTTFRIDSLTLREGTTTHIQAQAAFEDDAVSNTTYYNSSDITYERKDNLQTETLESTDAYFIPGVSTDKRTPTAVTGAKTYQYVTTTMDFTPSSCFKENREIDVTVTITNPNASIPNVFFATYYNDSCHVVPGSVKINGMIPLYGLLIEMENIDSEITPAPGMTTIEGVTLPNGNTVITYTIKTPLDKSDLEYDPNMYEDLLIGHALSVVTDDECLQNAFLKAWGEYSIKYCKSLDCIIINKMLQPRLKLN
jgi:uncharacterized repeat protein (TIGR01451 family)